MSPMPISLTWSDLACRLAITLIAGALIGLNRGESGHAAGLRTTMLVCLTACIAMLQVNVLLIQQGKPASSFVTLDLMRLPLGILSGVGFIGAGSILRRDGLLQGVTTAATLWYVTMIGLCAGGGQYVLAASGTILGLLVLQAIKLGERHLPLGRRAYVKLGHAPGQDVRVLLDNALRDQRCHVFPLGEDFRVTDGASSARVDARYEVRWRSKPNDESVQIALSRLVASLHNEASWSLEP